MEKLVQWIQRYFFVYLSEKFDFLNFKFEESETVLSNFVTKVTLILYFSLQKYFSYY